MEKFDRRSWEAGFAAAKGVIYHQFIIISNELKQAQDEMPRTRKGKIKKRLTESEKEIKAAIENLEIELEILEGLLWDINLEYSAWKIEKKET